MTLAEIVPTRKIARLDRHPATEYVIWMVVPAPPHPQGTTLPPLHVFVSGTPNAMLQSFTSVLQQLLTQPLSQSLNWHEDSGEGGEEEHIEAASTIQDEEGFASHDNQTSGFDEETPSGKDYDAYMNAVD